MKKYLVIAVVAALFTIVHSAHMEMENPPDVQLFETFLHDFEARKIHLTPTAQLLHGRFPFKFEGQPSVVSRQRRELVEPTEPGLAVSEDDLVKLYVQNEINRIFACYQRLRCGYTRAQAEQECKWLENSSLYHQIMKVLGIKHYPKRYPSRVPHPVPVPVPVVSQQAQAQQQQPRVTASAGESDAAINPAHRNLQNGIRYGARPGPYMQGGGYTNRNRRAYDSFFTNPQPAVAVNTL